MNKKYFLITYGCQANSADSERVSGLLDILGLIEAPTLSGADLVLVNTCSIRQASEDKVYGLATKLAQLRSEREVKVVLTGCLVGSATSERVRIEFDSLRRRMPWVDYYLNINELNLLPTYLSQAGLVDDWAAKVLGGRLWQPKLSSHEGVAYINISQGCDNFCTFCVVPYARGHEASRDERSIIDEVNHALKAGFSQIMLLGQNVNSWGLTAEKKVLSRRHLGGIPFADLLRKVHALDGLEKIKFLTSNPFDFSSDLVGALRLPKIDRYLHLPVQSGDDDVLRRMGRRHSRSDYLELVWEIRATVPEIELGTDVIVGFPGETEAQFLQTVDLVKKVRFNVVFISLYSPRPGTAGERLYADDVPRLEKRRRHAYLNQVYLDSKSG